MKIATARRLCENISNSNGKSPTEWGLQGGGGSACPCVSLTSLRKNFYLFISLSLFPLADSVKCLYEADALCQIAHQLAHFKGMHLKFAQKCWIFFLFRAETVEVFCRIPWFTRFCLFPLFSSFMICPSEMRSRAPSNELMVELESEGGQRRGGGGGGGRTEKKK